MLRMLTIAILVVGVCTGVVHAEHGDCYYDPSDMQGYNCSIAEIKVLGLMHQMEVAHRTDDWTEYMSLWRRGVAIDREEGGLRVQLHMPLQHYQIMDSTWVGENVKLAVLPGRRLVIQDKLARPIKMAGQWTTGSIGATVNWWLALFGGGTAGNVGKLLFPSMTETLITAVVGGTTTVTWTYAVDSFPEAGETEYLIHLLHTIADGREQVYRANVRVKPGGRLEVKARWKFLGYRHPGGDW